MPVCESCLGRVQPLELVAYCERCQRGLSPAVETSGEAPLCGDCRAPETSFDHLRAFGAYDPPLRDLIGLLKYQGVRSLAGWLGAWLALVPKRYPEVAAADLVLPVPLHPRRQRARGYNQAELLARELGRSLGLPVKTRLFLRTEDTPSQTGLTRAQRVENVRGAFRTHDKLDRKRILLVDDVCTTGATVDACARALKRAGAQSVEVVTLARVVEER